MLAIQRQRAGEREECVSPLRAGSLHLGEQAAGRRAVAPAQMMVAESHEQDRIARAQRETLVEHARGASDRLIIVEQLRQLQEGERKRRPRVIATSRLMASAVRPAFASVRARSASSSADLLRLAGFCSTEAASAKRPCCNKLWPRMRAASTFAALVFKT